MKKNLFKKLASYLFRRNNLAIIAKRLDRLERLSGRAIHGQKKILPFTYDLFKEKCESESNIHPILLSDLFPGIEDLSLPLKIINQDSGQHNHVDMLYVVAISQYVRAKKVFEFGTRYGKTTYFLTFASENTQVTTLDMPPDNGCQVADGLGVYYRGSDREKYIKQLFSDSKKFDTTPYKKSQDFIFIDADHSFEGVKNDTEKAFEMLNRNGVIVWHDYLGKTPGVVRFASEFSHEKDIFLIYGTPLLVYIDGCKAEDLKDKIRRRKKYLNLGEEL